MKSSIQDHFIEQIKQKADKNISLVNEIADVLQISNDSAYRRLRNETPLSLEESVKLAQHFRIRLEDVIAVKSDQVLFGRSTFRDTPEDFAVYLEKTEESLRQIAETKTAHGIYAAKDIPIFYFFQIPEIAEFKMFYWLKVIRSSSLIQSSKFDFGMLPESLMKKTKAIAKIYFQIPFAELWNEDTINVALRQIDYFHEAGWMASKSVALKVCEKMEVLIRIVQQQAETQLKWFDGKPVHPDVPFEFYFNDLAVLDNAMHVHTDQFEIAMIGYNAMDYLFTTHPGFCKEAEHFLKKQIGKSVLISGAAERERNKFFNRIYSRIQVLKEKIQNS